MKPIRTRADLMEMVAVFAPTTACARRIREGFAVVVGGFNPIDGLPGWIVTVPSKHKARTWHIAVCIDEENRKIRGSVIEEIPWESWVGRRDSPLMSGDNPKDNAYKRMRSRLENRSTKT